MMKKFYRSYWRRSCCLSGAVLAEEQKRPLSIAEQGIFSAGGTVTEPVEGDYDPTTNWLDATRAGQYGARRSRQCAVPDSRQRQRSSHRLSARLTATCRMAG